MCEIFISYSSGDKKAANQVCSALEARGIRCWIAPRDVPPGTEYANAIVDAINSTRLMVLVFSSRSNKSRHIKAEVQAAFESGMTIIPLRVEDIVPTGAMKHYISTFQWLDAFTPPLEMHLDELVDCVQKRLDISADKPWTKVSEQPPGVIEEVIKVKPTEKFARYLSKYRVAFISIVLLIILGLALSYIYIRNISSVYDSQQSTKSSLVSDKPMILTGGGRTIDHVTAIAVDGSYNAYITGFFRGTTSLGPGPDSVIYTSQADFDAYFIKLAPSGSLQWARTWGGTDSVKANEIALDSHGNIYIVGSFQGNADFDPGPGKLARTAQGDNDAYLIKFDSSGLLQWAHTWGGPDEDYASRIALDDSGNIYIVGTFEGTADFDPGLGTIAYTSQGNKDSYLIKFDSSGLLHWARTWGGSDSVRANEIVLDSHGNIHIVGFFQGTADFDPGPGRLARTAQGDYDAYLIKFDSSGLLQWAHTWGGSGEDGTCGVALDGSGNIYIVGTFEGTTDLNPGLGTIAYTSQGNRDSYLIKFDSSGSMQWAHTWGGPGEDGTRGVALDASGNIYIVGTFEGIVDFDPGLGTLTHTSQGETDPFLIKLNSSGSLQWAYTWGGSDCNSANKLALDGSGNIYIAGLFGGTADLDPGPGTAMCTAEGHSIDIYLSKVDSAGSLQWVKTWGSQAHNYTLGLSIDESDNICLAGHFGGTADLSPGPGRLMCSARRKDDAYLIKLDSAGPPQWARTWGGSEIDIAHGVTLDDSGNIYVTGEFNGTADLDPGPGTLGRTALGDSADDAYLIKLDSSGSLQWARTWGGPECDYAKGVDLDKSGNIYIVGYFAGTTDLDPGSGRLMHTAQGDFDSYLIKLDSSGLLHWAKTWGGLGIDCAENVTLDKSGSIYIVGHFNGTADFDPGPGRLARTAQGDYDAYLIKLDSSGLMHWAKTWGGSDNDIACDVALDESGDICIVGSFEGTADFDPGPDTLMITSQGDYDSYFVKLDSSGSLQWARTWGSTDFDEALEIAFNAHGNIYILGFFKKTADLDPGPGTLMRTAQGGDDSYLIKLDKDGNLIR